MKDFFNYKIEDYLADQSFRDWVNGGALMQTDAYWTIQLEQHPAQLAIALQARELLIATKRQQENFAADFEEKIIENTLKEVRSLRQVRRAPSRNWLFPLSAAASIALLLVTVWYFFLNKSGEDLSAETLANHTLAVVVLEKSNETDKVIPVALPDGSSVLLQPGSRISYPSKFSAQVREVNLSGQAFFEVVKNKDMPFFVRSQELVTRVLGTSFTVRAFQNQRDFAVVVKTGKVSVSATTGKNGMKSSVDLVPNQQVIFDRTALSLTRMAVKPATMQAMAPATDVNYIFNDTPVTEIFRMLAKRYNVTIEVNEELLTDCSLTTTFSDEPLFEKLKIICEAIGPSTKLNVEDSRIIINTKGCNL